MVAVALLSRLWSETDHKRLSLAAATTDDSGSTDASEDEPPGDPREPLWTGHERPSDAPFCRVELE